MPSAVILCGALCNPESKELRRDAARARFRMMEFELYSTREGGRKGGGGGGKGGKQKRDAIASVLRLHGAASVRVPGLAVTKGSQDRSEVPER